jgi:hypothetical protein
VSSAGSRGTSQVRAGSRTCGRTGATIAWRSSRGRAGVLASGFTVADDDALEGAERELERRGFAVRRLGAAAARARGVRSGIAFDDPSATGSSW